MAVNGDFTASLVHLNDVSFVVAEGGELSRCRR